MSNIFSEEVRNELQEIVTASVKSVLAQSQGKQTTSADRLLDTKEVSEYLGLTRVTIEKLSKDGDLNPIEIGERTKRFRLSDIESYLESKTTRRAS